MKRPRSAMRIAAVVLALPILVVGGADAQTQTSNVNLGPPVALSGAAMGSNLAFVDAGPGSSGLFGFTSQTGDNFVSVDQSLAVTSGAAISGATVAGTPRPGIFSASGLPAASVALDRARPLSAQAIDAPGLSVSTEVTARSGRASAAGAPPVSVPAPSPAAESIPSLPASSTEPGPALPAALAAFAALGGGLAAGSSRRTRRRRPGPLAFEDHDLGITIDVPAGWAVARVGARALVAYDPDSSSDRSPDQAHSAVLCLCQTSDPRSEAGLRRMAVDGRDIEVELRDVPRDGGRIRVVSYGAGAEPSRAASSVTTLNPPAAVRS